MSYEKYLKYKTKYLNLKAKLHNDRLNNNNNNQTGGATNDDNDNFNLPDRLTNEPSSIMSSNQYKLSSDDNNDNDNNEMAGGRSEMRNNVIPKKDKKTNDIMSDSDYNSTNSSLLSFSSTISSGNSDSTF